ncbi:hypothetical protein Tco_1477656 [Tanacetum coccineum]
MLIQHQSEEGDSLERAATTASSLEAEHVSGNITKTQSKATLNEPTPQGIGSGSRPKRQDTIGDTIARTRFENVSKTSYDSPLGGVNTPRNDEDRDYKPKKRLKKLEQRGRSRTPWLKRLYKVRTSRRIESSPEASLGDQEDASRQGSNIVKIDADVDISLVHEDAGIQRRFDDEDMFDTSVFNDEEVFAGQDMTDQEVNVAEKEVSVADLVTTVGEVVTIASVDISTPSVPITVSTATLTTPPTTTTEDDMTLTETLIEIKSAKPKAIGVVMQEPKEQALLTDEEKTSLFVQVLDARKKHFAALRAQEKRNKPPTKMQKRTTMCNYLKNIVGYKHNQLRHKSFVDIQKLFDKALKRVNTCVPMVTDKVEELDRESTKKQKVEDETEQTELKECFEIIPFDEDAVNTIPLATKQALIVDYKISRDARKIYYHITRADGSTQVYLRFKDMLKIFDREDLEVLYIIVKDKFKSTKPVGDNRV